MAPELPSNKARQGRGGSRVLVVLVVALVLAGVAWFAAGIFGMAIRPANPVGSSATMPNVGRGPGVPAGKAPGANGTPQDPGASTKPANGQ